MLVCFFFLTNKQNLIRGPTLPLFGCVFVKEPPLDPRAADTGFLRVGSASSEMRYCHYEETQWFGLSSISVYTEYLKRHCAWTDSWNRHVQCGSSEDRYGVGKWWQIYRQMGVRGCGCHCSERTEMFCSQQTAGQGESAAEHTQLGYLPVQPCPMHHEALLLLS